MRLGEFRTKTKNLDNSKFIRISVYDTIKLNSDGYVDVELDIVTNDTIFLRPVKEE